jgi:hypothetical protein
LKNLILAGLALSSLLACATAEKLMEPSATNSAINLKLDSSWKCRREKSLETVCEPTAHELLGKEVIIWVTKEKGDSDSIADYKLHLSQPMELNNNLGPVRMSTPKYTKVVKMNDQEWVDSLHWESEVPGNFTRYLVTLNDKTSAMITFTGDKEHFESFNKAMQPVIDQLKFKD